MAFLYVGMMVNIDPDEREMTVGAFNTAVERAQWSQDTLPSDVRALNKELGMDVGGIKVKTWFVESPEPLQNIIRPANAKRTIENIYRDVYTAY